MANHNPNKAKTLFFRTTSPEPKETTFRGVKVFIALSPFFFPKAVEGSYDEDNGILVVSFQYLTEENQEILEENHDLIDLYVGENTRRILSVHFKLKKNGIDRLGMTVEPQEIAEKKPSLEDFMIEIQEMTHRIIETAKTAKPELAENYDEAEEILLSHAKDFAELVR